MERLPIPGRAAALLLALAISAGCRTGVSEARFDAFDTRMEALTMLTSVAREQCAERADPEARGACLDAWNELQIALMGAHAAAATAYLVLDEEGFTEIERQVDLLLARVPALLEEE
jgi:expansin (peptidoglycan-binding protein)